MFVNKIRNVKETNMLEFVEYCFQQIPGARLWEGMDERIIASLIR